MAQAPRFLLVGPLPPPEHGNSVAFEMLCGELHRRGCDCKIIDLTRRAQSPYSRFSLVRSVELFRVLARFVVGLCEKYRRVYIIIAQSRSGFIRDMPMIWSAWLRGCRVVIHLRGGNYDGYYYQQPRWWQFLIRCTLRRTHRIVVLSERLRSMYAFDAAIGERIVVVPNGLPVALKGKSRNLSQPVRILFLSNLIQSKGYRDVLEAVGMLRETTSLPLEATFAGRFEASIDDLEPLSPQEAQARFQERVAALGLEETVRWVGPVVGRAKWNLFETSDFFVLPTNYANEALPISIIEAMAHGCVVISTPYRAIPDLVDDGVTGALVAYHQPAQIAAAIQQIAADHPRYAEMSKAAVARYEQYFTMQRHLDALIPLLERA